MPWALAASISATMAAVVNGALALGTAAGPRPGGHDHRVRSGDQGRDALLLHVAEQRLGPDRPQVVRVLGIAHDPPRTVTARGQQSEQLLRDLPVAPEYDDVHAGKPATVHK